jgi:hypothetical protein
MTSDRGPEDAAPAHAGPAIRTLIYGSCVSRDSFEYLGEPFHLSTYIARQSLISAMAPAFPLPDGVGEYTSPFQRRVALGDAASDLLVHLERQHRETDLVLWDLTDERLGVYLDPGGRALTRTVEMMTSGSEDAIRARARYVPFGSDEHFTLWRTALDAFVERLDRLRLRDRVILLDVAWASRTVRLHRAPSSFGTSARTANQWYRRYARSAEHAGIEVASLGSARVRAADSHRWGAAPFHYSAGTSRAIARAIRRHHARVVRTAPDTDLPEDAT